LREVSINFAPRDFPGVLELGNQASPGQCAEPRRAAQEIAPAAFAQRKDSAMLKILAAKLWETEAGLAELDEALRTAEIADLDEPLPDGVAGRADILSLQQWLDLNG